jgi:hypothetical protein
VASIIGQVLGELGELPGGGRLPLFEEVFLEDYPHLIAAARDVPVPFLVAIATKEICEGQATSRRLRLPPSRYDAKLLAGLRRVLAPAAPPPGRWFVERRVLSSSARRPRGRVRRRARAPGRPSDDEPEPQLEALRAAGLPPWLDRCVARVIVSLDARLPQPQLVDGTGA